jgi:hypothetical protein
VEKRSESVPQVGDTVRYFPVKDRPEFSEHVVREVFLNGMPSHRFPLLKLDGKAGVVEASHCKAVNSDG